MIELLVVIALVAILTALAVPSYTLMVANSRVRGANSNLQIALVKARAEALKRNCSITVSPKDGNWSKGWVVVATELACDPTHQLPPEDDADIPLQDDAVQGVTVSTVPAGLGDIVYLSSGRLQGASQIQFHTLDAKGIATRRCVVIEPSGMPKAKKHDDDPDKVDKCPSAPS